jgi:hypothetical protein
MQSAELKNCGRSQYVGHATLDSAFITLNSSLKMVGRLGFAPSSRRLRAGTSLSKFATLVAVCKDCDAKAELNRRGQACEVLTDTGISHREKWER